MAFRLVAMTVGVWAAIASGQGPLAIEQLLPQDVAVDSVQHAGRQAVRLLEPKGTRGGGIAVVKGATFRDGSIQVEVAGRKGPTALPDDRGFIGLAFRVRDGGAIYESIYLRPDNGRALDQVRRNHATQYISHPAFGFARLRKEAAEKYESYVDLEPGAWTRMRIEVAGTTARLFVHDASQPALVVTDLKLGTEGGGVALWIGPGTEGFFSNLVIK